MRKILCQACETYKPITSFVLDCTVCFECSGRKRYTHEQSKAFREKYPSWYPSNPPHADYQRSLNIERRYAICVEQQLEQLDAQEWACAECGATPRLLESGRMSNPYYVVLSASKIWDGKFYCRKCSAQIRRQQQFY